MRLVRWGLGWVDWPCEYRPRWMRWAIRWLWPLCPVCRAYDDAARAL